MTASYVEAMEWVEAHETRNGVPHTQNDVAHDRSVGSVVPTFLVIGAAKSGTTALHWALDTVSTIYASRPKELRYFAHPEDAQAYERYLAAFEPGRDHLHRGETCPHYTSAPHLPDTAARIHAMNPDIRLIYLIREPVARMVSAYGEGRRGGYELAPIDEALVERSFYLEGSRYYTQLRHYLRHFAPEQIHVETTEDLRAEPAAVLTRICDFLGTEFDGEVPNLANVSVPRGVRRGYAPVLRAIRERGHAGSTWQRRVQRSRIGSRRLMPGELQPSAAVVEHLRHHLVPELEALEEFLGRDLHDWKSTATTAADGRLPAYVISR